MTPGNTGRRGLVRFLLPWRCALCAGQARDGRELCDACAEGLPRAEQACPRCGIRVGRTDVTGTCVRCAVRPPGFHRMVAPLAYDYPVDRLLLGLKFGRRMHLARALGQAIAEGVRSQVERGVLEMPEALAPVPLHPRRLAKRGFNQAEEIARLIAREIGVPMLPDICHRVRHTRMQSRLSDEERRLNVAGAFACARSPLRPAIVDDVVTTGATADAMAAALIAAGAEHVQVWAAARAA
ncbi:MAG: double zinc ribbon domain-containing protein [Gammaproteobacteria bacterium]|nr:double zinc ribbon domain-containing protein [Gammaproteobacteria bacterium]